MKRGRRLHRFIENLVIGLAVLLFGAIVFEGIRRLPGASGSSRSAGPAAPTRPTGAPPSQPPPFRTPPYTTPPYQTPRSESSLPPGAAPFGMSRTMPAPASLPAIGLSDNRRRKAKPADVPAPGQ